MPRIFQRFRLVFLTYDWSIMEFFGATTKIFWAVFLLQSFPAFRSISGYTSVASENVWGFGLLFLGISHFMSIWLHRLGWKNMIWARRIFTFIALLFWVFTGFIIFQQAGRSALIIFFINLALFMFLNFLRLWIPEDNRMLDLGRPNGLPDRRVHE